MKLNLDHFGQVFFEIENLITGVNSVDYQLVSQEAHSSHTHLKIELRRLKVESLNTNFYETTRVPVEILNMAPKPCSYERLEKTVICEEYGHTMVLKSLRKKQLTYAQAVQKD